MIGTAFASGFVLLKPRGAVDWTAARAVVIESDDWGLCGFTPSRGALDSIDIEAICPGEFPPVYLYSTLEDGATVARLADLLSAHPGRDGVPAVFQPNYIMGSLSYAASTPDNTDRIWRRAILPSLPEKYGRDDLWPAVRQAIAAGVWWPEYHGMWHYDPEDRRTTVAGNGEAQDAARLGLLIFPDGARSYELALDRDPEEFIAELREGMGAFAKLFGRAPQSVAAPDYAWDRLRERMWLREGLRIIQAKREQRSLSKLEVTIWDRIWKVCERSWRYLTEKEIVYLNRNCRLEGAQAEDSSRHASTCIESVQRAWRSGEPAIVGTHRVNYAHFDPETVDVGFAALVHVLDQLGGDPEHEPIYLTDVETAQLLRSGTSLRSSGQRLVLRNLTHSRRPVRLPATDGRSMGIVWLSPRTTHIIDLPYAAAD
ncbi:hypothetical protein KJ554_04490 [bacterium]|nr:hypothetical protein [bacterium]